MAVFEYFFVKGAFSFKSSIEKFEKDLNTLGLQGWEAVSQTGDPVKSVYVLMKRQVSA
jgi:hypothetical protein